MQLRRRDNYLLQAQAARARFLRRDASELARVHRLHADERFLYTAMLRRPYRVSRATGALEKQLGGAWCDADSHDEVMTLLDYLCDARADRTLARVWQTTEHFSHAFHRSLLEARDPAAERFDRNPDALRAGGALLGGEPLAGADIGFTVALFEDFPVGVQFWHSDEEFAPRLRFLWDENALQYLRYETMWFAMRLIRARLLESAGEAPPC